MNECILITGGAGFIGSALSHLLVGRQGLPVVVMDCLHPQVHPERRRPQELHSGAELMLADVCDPSSWDKFLEEWRPKIVVHLAAETGTGQSLSEASRHTHVNVTGTARMLDAFAAVGHVPSRIVLSSSRAIYGEGQWLNSNGEIFNPGQRPKAMLDAKQWDFEGSKAIPFIAGSTPPNPSSIYGATKLAQEQILHAWGLSYESEIVTLRLQNVYGPGQSLHNPYTGIVSLFARLARESQSIPLYEDGLMRRDFIFISDVVRALHMAMYSTGISGNTYDIGYGQPTTIADMANLIVKYYRGQAPHVCGKYRNGDVRHAGCDITRTETLLNWKPQISLEEGVAQLCQWINTRLEGI
jgi:dTDP-L-rhamnose 4-epimerase